MPVASPIAYFVFNRPQHTRTTFAQIREQQPRQLFVIADGPRPDYSSDQMACAEVRDVVSEVDWQCEVRRNYAHTNLGLKLRFGTGLDWVFGEVERAIVLEDDCLAHPDFFAFCDALLERYADDPRVAVVTGDNFQRGRRSGEASYYFSKYNHVWGWATWRRAWENYDADITFWREWRASDDWRRIVPDRVERRYWRRIFDRVARGKASTWDYPWTASTWHNGGLTATPNANLVTNIGIGPAATHTYRAVAVEGEPIAPLGPMTHPPSVKQDLAADRFVFDHHFGGRHRRIMQHPLAFFLWALAGSKRRVGRALATRQRR